MSLEKTVTLTTSPGKTVPALETAQRALGCTKSGEGERKKREKESEKERSNYIQCLCEEEGKEGEEGGKGIKGRCQKKITMRMTDTEEKCPSPMKTKQVSVIISSADPTFPEVRSVKLETVQLSRP